MSDMDTKHKILLTSILVCWSMILLFICGKIIDPGFLTEYGFECRIFLVITLLIISVLSLWFLLSENDRYNFDKLKKNSKF